MVSGYNWTDVCQAIGTVAGSIISLVGFVFLYIQIKQIGNSLRSQNHSTIYQIATEINLMLVDNSDLRPYIFENKSMDVENKNYKRLLATIESLLDFYEFIILENKNIEDITYKYWTGYMQKIYSKSVVMREYLESNPDFYIQELIETVTAKKKVNQ